jgi:hypothetical protein
VTSLDGDERLKSKSMTPFGARQNKQEGYSSRRAVLRDGKRGSLKLVDEQCISLLQKLLTIKILAGKSINYVLSI